MNTNQSMMQNHDVQILDFIDEDDYFISNVKPSVWGEKKRIMSTEVSNFPGPFNYDRTPYLKEIIDCLSKDHPANEVAVMKGAQLGFSTGVIENGIGWIIAENPGNILLAARDEGLVKKMMDTKIDQMIDSCDLRDFIKPNTVRARNQRTGDTSMMKEFAGGSLNAFSIQKPGRMRQVSMKFGFLDDFEAAPRDKDAGDAASLFRTRFKSFGGSKKLFWISTPEVKQTSNIEKLYLRGDQRKYHVPCPFCGDYIILEWRTVGKDGKRAGISYKVDEDGDLIDGTVAYKCQSCGDFFNEGHKYKMNLAGEWRPTAKQKDPTFFSYHLSSLYAPPGMDDWSSYVKEYLEACPRGGKIDLDKYKTFINTALGETWEEKGHVPKVMQLALNTRGYQVGLIPNVLSMADKNGEIVMITCACDLNGTVEDARLDYEIVAWSERGVSYSIDHGSIGTFVKGENTLKNPEDREKWTYENYGRNVWDPFLELIQKPYESMDGEREYKISIVGIDSGHFTQYAYDFIDLANDQGVFTVGLKGKGEMKYRNTDASTSIFHKAKERSDLYLIEVNQVKDELSASMPLRWYENNDVVQPNGFMNFPTPSNDKYIMKTYFSHFESEHKILKKEASGKEIGFMWDKRNSNVANHFWDVKVYNMAIKEIFMHLVCVEAGIKEPNWQLYCKILTGK